MSKTYTTLSREAYTYLIGLIRNLANISEGVDDLHLRSDGTFSSVKINTLLNTLKSDCTQYTDTLVANLARLELKLVTDETDISQPNIMYLYKPAGATSYNQYVVIDGTKVLLGTCDIDMQNYYTISATDAKFCLKTDYDTLTTDYDTHKKDTDIHTTATEKASYVKKTDIVDDLTSTDTNKPLSANQGKILDDKKLNKNDADKITIIDADNVNIKDFILEKCVEQNKTYYITARSTCTDMPKSNAHYYMTVEIIGSFTTKVTAKELGGTNDEYVSTYRSDLSKWTDWQKVVIGERNLNTYSDVTQLGLTIPTTVSEIFKALPNFSLLRFQVDNYSVTDAPLPNGILIIDKIRSAKFTIEFKCSADGTIAENSLYIGQLKGSDASGLTWSKLLLESDMKSVFKSWDTSASFVSRTGQHAIVLINGTTLMLWINLDETVVFNPDGIVLDRIKNDSTSLTLNITSDSSKTCTISRGSVSTKPHIITTSENTSISVLVF